MNYPPYSVFKVFFKIFFRIHCNPHELSTVWGFLKYFLNLFYTVVISMIQSMYTEY
ncbi:hypothetical protein BMW23_0349 [Bodo saltans virus]|uniref:Uncharacterized protein n=1 Tax=Bodo saltans virus TaxID=2024608 RepID=A0A2H4UU63_9VIRU|nr:hypothetical protein QJ851_gp0341 [Bodo saltans virus]ATZ80404.1 hypothetical protein BMW23_0349 [Bodo saltans virus]